MSLKICSLDAIFEYFERFFLVLEGPFFWIKNKWLFCKGPFCQIKTELLYRAVQGKRQWGQLQSQNYLYAIEKQPGTVGYQCQRVWTCFSNSTTLSLENVARGGQSSRGEVIPGGNPAGMSYLFYYTEQIQNTKGGKITNTRNFG